MLTGLLVAATIATLAPHASNARFLPLVRTLFPIAGPVITFGILLVLKATLVLPGVTVIECLVVCLGAGLTAGLLGAVLRLSRAHLPATRVAVVGPRGTAIALAMDLERRGRRDHEVVGYLRTAAADGRPIPSPERAGGSALGSEGRAHRFAARMSRVARVRRSGRSAAVSEREAALFACPLGNESEVDEVVARHDIELVILAGEASRMVFFKALASGAPDQRLRAVELSTFYEDVCGHVPLNSINAAWFHWLMDPAYTTSVGLKKRAFDVGVALAALILLAPLAAVLAFLIARDGGPVLYRQPRIGEGGRRFEILKFRSMVFDEHTIAERWADENDERVTAVGRFVRRTHLDELPQLWNVLRGDMSIVGPRPEQPAFVAHLERQIQFYDRRQLARPGLTGWAQVNCGYAGSEDGSLWKLSHDLYYLKHRSFGFDLMILVETLRLLVTDRQYRALSLPALVTDIGSVESMVASVTRIGGTPEDGTVIAS